MCSLFSSSAAKEIDCYVHLLDSNTKPFSLPGNSKGQDLLRAVLNSLGVQEQQFFGLKFLDLRKEWQWMSAKKSVHSLVKSCHGGIPEVFGEKSCHLYLAVRYYPNDPCRELSEPTRLQIFLQVIQDIQTKTVTVPRNHASRLAALMLQSFHGDFDHQKGFPLDQYDLFADLRPGIDAEVETAYRLFKGLHASQAEYQFLDYIKWFDGYGRITFSVILENDIPYFLCIETTGIVLRDQKQTGVQTCFYWPRIKTFLLKKHKMVMKVRSKTEDGCHTFRTANSQQLRSVWKACCEHLEFFRSGSDPSFRQMSDSMETPAPTRRPSGRSRRRDAEPRAVAGGSWQQQQQQQRPQQYVPSSPASYAAGSPSQSQYNSESEHELYRPSDTRSVRELRAVASSSASVAAAEDAYRPFMSDTEAVAKAGKFRMIRERYYRQLGADELYNSGSTPPRQSAGGDRRTSARPAQARSRSSSSRPRRPAGLEASAELLSHIRHDRIDASGLSQEQRQRIEFTQLRADSGFRVSYDPATGRGRVRLAPRTEILPRASARADSLGGQRDDLFTATPAYAVPPEPLRPQLQAVYDSQQSLYSEPVQQQQQHHQLLQHSGEWRHRPAARHWHAHNSSYQAAVSDSEVTAPRQRQQQQPPPLAQVRTARTLQQTVV